jgi:signal transduction histidine kinase
MAISASSEFVALCQSQLRLLAEALSTSLSVVYLTEEWVEGATSAFFPVATYPDVTDIPSSEKSRILLPRTESLESGRLSKSGSIQKWQMPQFTPQHQVVLPLQQDGFVLGFLQVGRDDRDWTSQEYAQLELVVQTLTSACVIDRRLQWIQQRYHQQELYQERQQDMLDTLLHQLKNPLTALKTFGKLLLRRLQPDDRNQDIATGILRESDRLQFLLQQFHHLDLQQLDLQPFDPQHSDPRPLDPQFDRQSSSGLPTLPAATAPNSLPQAESRLTESTPSDAVPNAALALVGPVLTLEPCALNLMLESLLNAVQAIAQERQLTLKLRLTDALPPVQANDHALREVLSNLLDNALKYTPPGGEIAIYSGIHPTYPQWQGVVVSDTGLGIPSEDLPKLFEKRYRGVQAAGSIAGTGLGLAIARDLVEQMQGRLEVISPAGQWHPCPGEDQTPGAAFLVWLPIAQFKGMTR